MLARTSPPKTRRNSKGLAPHPIDIRAGRNLRLARIRAGFSQEQFARAVRITFQQVQKYERGTNRMSLSRAWQFSVVLRVPVEFFFQRTGRTVRAAAEPFLAEPQFLQWMALYREVRDANILPGTMKIVRDITQLCSSEIQHLTRD